jgi:hypothetical protein
MNSSVVFSSIQIIKQLQKTYILIFLIFSHFFHKKLSDAVISGTFLKFKILEKIFEKIAIFVENKKYFIFGHLNELR